MGEAKVWMAPWGVLTEDVIQEAETVGPLRTQARCAAMQARATIEAMYTQQGSNVELIRMTEQTAIATSNMSGATGALVDTTAALVAQTRRLVTFTKWVAVFTALAALAAGAAAIVAAVQ